MVEYSLFDITLLVPVSIFSFCYLRVFLTPQTGVRTTESQLKRTSCGKQTRPCRVVLHSVDSVSDRDARNASSVGCIAILFI